MKFDKKARPGKFGRRNPALADDEVLLCQLPIAEEESREGASHYLSQQAQHSALTGAAKVLVFLANSE